MSTAASSVLSTFVASVIKKNSAPQTNNWNSLESFGLMWKKKEEITFLYEKLRCMRIYKFQNVEFEVHVSAVFYNVNKQTLHNNKYKTVQFVNKTWKPITETN